MSERLVTLDQVSSGDQLPELRYDVTATTVVLGALATRDWRPMHHDYDFAVNRNGVKDVFLNTPNQAHWFERYVTDWTGPRGRIGRMIFRMQDSVYPNEQMVFNATVTGVNTDETGCGWVDLDVRLTVDQRPKTSCEVRVALPSDVSDNPWGRTGESWKPRPS